MFKILKNKESHTLRDRDTVTHGWALYLTYMCSSAELWSRAGGLTNAAITVHAFFFGGGGLRKIPTIYKTYLYLFRDGYFHFQTGFGTCCFFFYFPWMSWFRIY